MLMGMESSDTRRKADDSYRAQSAGRSLCAAGRCPAQGGDKWKACHSLSIAFWLTGSIWIVGFIAYLGDAPVELVIPTLFVG